VKHFIVYHSVEKMGHSFREEDDGESGGDGGFGIVTRKSTAVTAEVKRLHGHRCQVCGLRCPLHQQLHDAGRPRRASPHRGWGHH
jgi:hypothetical protein